MHTASLKIWAWLALSIFYGDIDWTTPYYSTSTSISFFFIAIHRLSYFRTTFITIYLHMINHSRVFDTNWISLICFIFYEAHLQEQIIYIYTRCIRSVSRLFSCGQLKLSLTLKNSICYCYTTYEMTDQFLWFQVQMNSYSSNWNTPD